MLKYICIDNRDQRVFPFKIIINVLVSSFCFTWLRSICYGSMTIIYIVASELKDPICHSDECQIGFFSSEATILFDSFSAEIVFRRLRLTSVDGPRYPVWPCCLTSNFAVGTVTLTAILYPQPAVDIRHSRRLPKNSDTMNLRRIFQVPI